MAQEVIIGKVGITPQGDWSASYNDGNGYALLDEVHHKHDAWVSKVANNTAEPGTDATKWFKSTDGGSYVYGLYEDTQEAIQNANEAAEAARAAVVVAELPAVAEESSVRGIVSGYEPATE